LSRVTGFVRDAVFAFFFGTGVAADAYAAALRIPNILRNLLGEGTLAASFVPVYSALLERGDRARARGIAATLGTALAALAAFLSAAGVAAAPWLTRLLVPGWEAEATALTVRLARILFPMAGFMMLGGWCLGILNSHRRFFLPYAAPVVWNLAQIAGLLAAAATGAGDLIGVLAWATLAGGALQFGVQLPSALRCLGGWARPAAWRDDAARTVARNFVPVVTGAGVWQVSGFLDVVLASFAAHGAVSALYYAQRLYYLPLSLFGTSVAAAALPELARDAEANAPDALRTRLVNGFRQILYFVVPAAAAFLVLGDLVIGVLYQRGDFGPDSALVVHVFLACYALGLVPAASVRLFASGFHGMWDTRTPLRYAVAAMALSAALGAGLLFTLRGRVQPAPLAAAGIAAGAAVGAWTNLWALWRGLRRRLGPLFRAADLRFAAGVAAACLPAAAAAYAAERALHAAWPAEAGTARAILLAGTAAAFGGVYWMGTRLLRVARPGWIPGPATEP
jgi:putative peptidoglycan lipid II flippase